MTPFGSIAAARFVIRMVVLLLPALGVRRGTVAWGGRIPGVLPVGLRVASAVAGLVLYLLMIAYVVDAARLATVSWLVATLRIATGVRFGLFASGPVTNTITRSPIERT